MFLINVGNTHIQLAEWSGSKLGKVLQYETAAACKNIDILTPLIAKTRQRCLIASVVPKIDHLLVQHFGTKRHVFLKPAMIPEVNFSRVVVETLGADRLGNVAAAVESHGCPFAVLDCGTAITTEVVDADGYFRGGTIMPGRLLWRRSLHDFTGKLPLIKLQDKCPPALGRNTEDAIIAGVDLGILGAVEKVLAEIRQELNLERITVIAVGGDAPFFLRHLDNLQAGDRYFTLRGLQHVAERLSSLPES